MKLRDKLLIKNYYKEYYFKSGDILVKEINDLESREFAYIDFEGVMKRHIALSVNNINKWLFDEVPRDFYHSSAYYLFPEKDMGQKDWQGGDLIFDIDLDHIKTYTPRVTLLCINKEYKVISDVNECVEGMLKKIVIIDEKGMEEAKKETIRLIEILVRDFDFKVEDLKIYFSGGRGFHIHIDKSNIIKLDAYTRMEIKDYITLDGFDILNIASLDNRVMEEFRKRLYTEDGALLRIFSVDEVNKLKNIFRSGKNLSKLKKEISKKLRDKINKFVNEYIGVSIDGVVTVDTSRLIRVPFSLHGKTGLIKKRINYEDLDDFNPFVDAIRNDETFMELYVHYMPEMFWMGEYYGPIFNSKVRVPFSLGIYLINEGLGYGGKQY